MSLFKFKNAQEYYDALVQTSANGGFPAKDEATGSCRYRTYDGKGCAVGIGIPEEHYRLDLEGSISWLNHKNDQILPEWTTIKDLVELQSVHDILSNLDKWNHKVFLDFINRLPLFNCVLYTY